MQRWEHIYVRVILDEDGVRTMTADNFQVKGWDRRPFKEVFCHFGDQGWELVAAQAEQATHHLYFKRPKADPESPSVVS